MNYATDGFAGAPVEPGERDWWPLTRLVLVGAVLGLTAHQRFGWNPTAHDLWALPGAIATIGASVLLLSSALAQACLVVLALPVCGVILLNDWLYDGTVWALRVTLSLESRPLLAILGLCGEVLLFAATLNALRMLFAV